MKTIELLSLASALVGLITGLPYLARLVKRFLPLSISFAKGILSVFKEMLIAVAEHPNFIMVVAACPWVIRSGFYLMGVLLAILASHEKKSIPTCLGCFIVMAAVGQVEFYLFSKMASLHKNNITKK